MDLHDELERYAHERAAESGARLRDAQVRARLESRVTRGRRVRSAAVGAGTLAAVSLLAVGAVMVPQLGGQSAPGSGRPTAPSGSTPPGQGDTFRTFSTDLPKVTLDDFFSVIGLNGPQDGIVDEPWKISQEIPQQFACGAPSTLEPGYYSNQGAAVFASFDDTVAVKDSVFDVSASDAQFASEAATGLGMYYDTFVLAWVKGDTIVGNARVTRADGPLIQGTEGARLRTVRGADGAGPGIVELPLRGPGACEAGTAPADLADGAYELHVIHEYGSAEVRVNGHQYSDPRLWIEYPDDTKAVEFISADAFGAFVDPEGEPWTVDVVGLDVSEN